MRGERTEKRKKKTEDRRLGFFLFCFLFSVFCFLFFESHACYAYTVSSDELIERARDIDGKDVVYRGELVTAILARGDHSWINLNDGANAIGVWCESASLGDIKFIGGYKTRGDVIEVAGVFNRACKEHNGELDIHAYRLSVVREGFCEKERIDRVRPYLAVVFLFLASFIALRYKRRS